MAKTAEDKQLDAATVIRALKAACNELMTEFVSRKRAADWGVINDAMVDADRFLGAKAERTATRL